MHHHTRVTTGVAAAFALALASGTVAAQGTNVAEAGLDWTLRAGVGYTDNLGRDGGDTIDSAFYSLGGSLTYVRQQGRVNANVGLNLDWVDYEAAGFDSQVWGNMNGSLRYALIPERLVWVFENDFGQGTRDPLSSRTPDNVENMNYFTTGPELTLRFADTMGAVIDARYSNVWFQDSPNNNDRFEGGLTLFRDFSSVSRAYMRGNYQDVQFDSGATAPDFDQTDVVAGYTNQGSRTSLLVEAGYNTLSTENDTQSGPLFKLQVSRELTPALTGSLRAGQEFNDSARDLRSQGSFGNDPTGQDTSGQAYEDQYVGGGLVFERSRTNARLAVDYHEQTYVETGTGLDRDRLEFNASVTRQLSRAWSAGLSARLESVDFTDPGSDDYDENEYGADLSWGATPALNFVLSYSYYTRPSSSFGTFDENRVWLRGDWSPGRR